MWKEYDFTFHLTTFWLQPSAKKLNKFLVSPEVKIPKSQNSELFSNALDN